MRSCTSSSGVASRGGSESRFRWLGETWTPPAAARSAATRALNSRSRACTTFAFCRINSVSAPVKLVRPPRPSPALAWGSPDEVGAAPGSAAATAERPPPLEAGEPNGALSKLGATAGDTDIAPAAQESAQVPPVSPRLEGFKAAGTHVDIYFSARAQAKKTMQAWQHASLSKHLPANCELLMQQGTCCC